MAESVVNTYVQSPTYFIRTFHIIFGLIYCIFCSNRYLRKKSKEDKKMGQMMKCWNSTKARKGDILSEKDVKDSPNT